MRLAIKIAAKTLTIWGAKVVPFRSPQNWQVAIRDCPPAAPQSNVSAKCSLLVRLVASNILVAEGSSPPVAGLLTSPKAVFPALAPSTPTGAVADGARARMAETGGVALTIIDFDLPLLQLGHCPMKQGCKDGRHGPSCAHESRFRRRLCTASIHVRTGPPEVQEILHSRPSTRAPNHRSSWGSGKASNQPDPVFPSPHTPSGAVPTGRSASGMGVTRPAVFGEPCGLRTSDLLLELGCVFRPSLHPCFIRQMR